MKISEKTLGILKNFSTINQSILVRPGNTIRTIHPMKAVFADATVEETFPTQFAIYELSKFLGALSLFDEPDLDFFDDHLKISEGKKFIRFVYADPSMIVVPPAKKIELPSKDVYFELSEKDIGSINKAISILGVPEMSIVGENGTIYAKAMNSKNVSSDQYSLSIGVTDMSFNAIIKAEHMKFLPADYRVNLSKQGYAEFATDNLTYWVAIHHTSKFGI